MSSESNAAFQTAREAISVPSVPLDAIRRAAKTAPETPKRKRLLAGVLGGLVLIGTAAVATETWRSVHIGLASDGRFMIASDGMKTRLNHHPTAADLEAAAEGADFPVTLPAGLPKGAVAKQLFQLGNSGIMISYDLPGAWRADNHMMWIILANPKSLAHPGKLDSTFAMQLGGEAGTGQEFWHVGGETVIFPHSTATAAEMARIKAAMTAAATRTK